MHPHNTSEAKEAFEKAQAEWYEQRYRDEIECYTLWGFLREMKWFSIVIGLASLFIWLSTRR